MIFLFGFGDKLQKSAYMGIRYCRRCQKFQHFYLLRHKTQFTLFFVPVLWHTKGYYSGCGICQTTKPMTKLQFEQMKEKYSTFPSLETTKDIYEFCVDMAGNRENTQQNIEWLFNQVVERFDIKGFEDDFYTMIANIIAVQEAARFRPRIID